MRSDGLCSIFIDAVPSMLVVSLVIVFLLHVILASHILLILVQFKCNFGSLNAHLLPIVIVVSI